MNNFHLHIKGIVQGVGFRPLAYRLASEKAILGTIENGSDGLHLYLETNETTARELLNELLQQAPAAATILEASIEPSPARKYSSLSIISESNQERDIAVLMSPDLALCPQCRAELHDPTNRRYRYPFITCTHCGPRYSIMQQLPYERIYTAMQSFTPCEDCSEEYEGTDNRRFYSQTNSCHQCGMHLQIHPALAENESASTEETLEFIRQALSDGKIIAVKGIGGYLLLCDAANSNSIQLLRLRKQRPGKPLAVLYPSFEAAKNDFYISDREKSALLSPEAPIVLLPPRPMTNQQLALEDIAPGLHRIGILLPYNPLLELIATDYQRPLIATSGNKAGSPILFDPDEADSHLGEIADFIIHHDRPIVIPEDDSVLQYAPQSGIRILLRRSRGFAPSFTQYRPASDVSILATGALLKSSFALSVKDNLFVSQYLGNTDRFEAQQSYRHTLEHWLRLYQIRPDLIVADSHPDYFSTHLARELSDRFQVPIQTVQHHEAHAMAILAEHQLIDHPRPVACFIWDGTGWGTDGNSWGGETFICHQHEMIRVQHFDYFPGVAGDRMALEPRIAALSACFDLPEAIPLLRKKFSVLEWKTYQALATTSDYSVSSAGRLFDAVASLLGISDRQRFEGEAALQLQTVAESYLRSQGQQLRSSYCDDGCTSTPLMLERLINDLRQGSPAGLVAAKFHLSLAKLIGNYADHLQTDTLCFSGGVFQNSLLVDWIQQLFQDRYQLYFHRELSPNDENISFGQLAYCDHRIQGSAPITCTTQTIIQPHLLHL